MKERLVIENIFFRQDVDSKHHFADIIRQSDSLKYVLYRVEQVASLDTSVLILGETGREKWSCRGPGSAPEYPAGENA